MEFNVPLFDQKISTSEADEAGSKFVGMLGGSVIAMTALAGASFVFNRVKNASGLGDDGFDVPGV